MTNSKSPIFRISKKKKTDLFGKVFAGVVIGSSIVGTAAILMSAPYKAEYKSEPIKPVKKAQIAPAPAPVVEMKAEVVKAEPVAPKPEPLAIAHEDADTDFVAQASEQLSEGDLTAAMTSLRKSLHRGEPTIDVLIRIGRLGRELQQLDIAERALLKAAKRDPRDALVKIELARIYMKMDQPQKAHRASTDAINLDKEHPSAWNLVGRSAMALSQWQRAEAALSQAVELDPLNAMYRNNLGLLFVKTKKADPAIDELETAVELFEDNAPHFVFNNLGLAHEMAGNFEEAREAFEEALVISPFYARATVNLRRVETTIAAIEEKKAFDTAKSMELDIIEEDLEVSTEL